MADSETTTVMESHRGIPRAPFVERVEDFVSSRAEVQSVLNKFAELTSRYRSMELVAQSRATGLKERNADLVKTLETVRFLNSRDSDSEPLEAHFELNDTLYANVEVPPTEEVYIWLGANVMLSYPIPEALTLLESKLGASVTSYEEEIEKIAFIGEQITTMEVATARVYNWDVVQRRKERAEGGSSTEDRAGPKGKG